MPMCMMVCLSACVCKIFNLHMMDYMFTPVYTSQLTTHTADYMDGNPLSTSDVMYV